MSSFDNTVLEYLKKLFSLDACHFYLNTPSDNKKLKNSLSDGTCSFPVLKLFSKSNYVLNEYWQKSDLKNEICVDSFYVITILSDNIDDIISLEDVLNKSLSEPKPVYDLINDPRCSSSDIFLLTDEKPERKSSDNADLFQSILKFKVEHVFLHKDIVNPIRIELDNCTAKQIMKHLAILDEAALCLENQISEVLSTDTLSNFKTTEDKISNMSEILRLRYNELQDKYKDIISQITEMYTFESICKEKLELKEHAFKFCYQTMNNKECNLIEATEIYKEKIIKEKAEKEALEKQAEIKRQEEEKRINRLKKILSASGDKIINHYTDAIVSDIKNSYADELGISVYGGSTFGIAILIKNKDKIPNETIEIPDKYIIVIPSYKFIFNSKKYTNFDKDGEPTEYSYSLNSFPVEYSFKIQISCTNPVETKEIENALYNIYKDEKSVTVSDLQCTDKFNLLKLKIDVPETANDTPLNSELHNEVSIPFTSHIYVYHTYNVDKNELPYNHALQLALIKQGEYCENCAIKMKEAIKKLEYDYKGLVTPPQTVWSKMFRGAFETEDYKRLQQMFDNRLQIDKNLFHSVLKDIIGMYPPLWYKMCIGWSVEQIKADMEKYISYFNDRALQLRTLLDIPISFINYKESDLPVFTFIADYMSKSSFSLTDNGIYAYSQYLQKQQEKRNEAARRMAEAERKRQVEQEESYYYERPSRSDNNADKKSRKSSKDCLWGTAMCPYGKPAKEYDPKSSDSRRISCDLSCPLHSVCGGRK